MKQTTAILRSRSTFRQALVTEEQILNFFEKEAPLGFILCGRSNVGKSSLINALLKNNISRISNTPGKTKDINVYRFFTKQRETPFYLFDLPGFGHANVSKAERWRWDKSLDFFLTQIPQTIKILHLMDSRLPFQKVDTKFIEYFDGLKRDCLYVFTKVDKIKKQKDKVQLLKQTKDLKRTSFQISSQSSAGLIELENYLLNHLYSLS
jgi:GTP-binding protein